MEGTGTDVGGGRVAELCDQVIEHLELVGRPYRRTARDVTRAIFPIQFARRRADLPLDHEETVRAAFWLLVPKERR